jgi:hypothetical protein
MLFYFLSFVAFISIFPYLREVYPFLSLSYILLTVNKKFVKDPNASSIFFLFFFFGRSFGFLVFVSYPEILGFLSLKSLLSTHTQVEEFEIMCIATKLKD